MIVKKNLQNNNTRNICECSKFSGSLRAVKLCGKDPDLKWAIFVAASALVTFTHSTRGWLLSPV